MRFVGTSAWALLIVMLPARALAWPHVFDTDGISGVLSRDDEGLVTECSMVVDRPPETVHATLLDYERIGAWMPQTIEYKVVSRTGTSARYLRRSRAPMPLAPNPWAIVEATTTPMVDGRARVEWHRVEGSIKKFDATWDIEPAGGGTRVTYRVHAGLPFPLPEFVIRRIAPNVIMDTLRGLRSAARSRPALPAPPRSTPAITDAGSPPDTGVAATTEPAP